MSDESTKDMIETGRKWTASCEANERQRAEKALDELAERNARPELRWVVDSWSASCFPRERRAAERAFQALKNK